ncbi:MAG: glycosyltransferase family 2 protein, partial [Pseudomonadota bacterium]|nr:glycosyltransferase family 2 protein [Pseudomonadota bacterium]
APRRAAAASPSPFVTVVVPVYEDFEATRACLEALDAARPNFASRILVVDDASPNADLAAYLDAQAARGAFELIRNEVNLGFAASVNKALARREAGDALLLNADAVLPPGAIDRLRELSRSSPDIGALTPLSNNGELTSYPLRNQANAMPTAAEIAALDARARAVNGDALVDIPNGIGFCLYVTQACLDAVGGLPELYAQGYYEDVEFCLAAREQGFRNVAATGVYVGHAGSRSFGARKRALVMRNLQLIEARFPGYRLETAAFVALDPLKPYRAALDAACPPAGPVTLIASGPGAAAAWGARRARLLKAQAPEQTVLTACARGRVLALAAVGEGAPQSLEFDFATASGAAGFRAYLDWLDLRRVELLDPAALPDEALSRLLAREAEIDLLCGDFGWFSTSAPPARGDCGALDSEEPCESCRAPTASRPDEASGRQARRLKLGRALERAGRVIPLDPLAESFAQRVFKARAAPFEGARAPSAGRAGPLARLGVLYPHRQPATDRLLLRLARRLAASGADADIVVFGETLDDNAAMATGRMFVAGRASPDDYLALGEYYAVDGWLAPDRGGGYGDLEATARGAPKAYFDWSFGAFAVEWGDLSLDPRICEDKAAARIARWMSGERTGPG